MRKCFSDHFVMLQRVMEIAKLLDTSRIRIFSFWRESSISEVEEEIIRNLRRAADIAEAGEMQLLLENEPSCNGGNGSEAASLVKAVRSPALQLLWDPGNEQYTGRIAYPDGYEKVKGFVAHVHLKDALIDSNGVARCVPIGSGTVAFRPQLEALLKDGYQGLFTIETHYVPPGGTARDGSTMTLNGLRPLLDGNNSNGN
jgi:L-ribulose-5-phosphate 3-epimerase